MQSTLQEAVGADTESRGVRKANFKVLEDSRHPAIMIEGAFLSNTDDLALFKDPGFLKRLAKGAADGVIAFDER